MTKVNIISKKNFTQNEEILLNKAIELIEQVINSEVFKNKILNFSYNGKNEFNFNRGMKNEEIYNLLISGKEAYNNQIDFELDFILEISNDCPSGVVGTTYGGRRTETYRCKLNEMNAAEYAGHLIHEYCHYLGFTHTKRDNSTRKYTVPYAIGYIVRDLSTVLLLNLSAIDSKSLFAKTKDKKSYSVLSNVISKKSINDETGNVGVEYLNDKNNFVCDIFNPVHAIDINKSQLLEEYPLKFWQSPAIFMLNLDNPLASQSIEILNESLELGLEIEVTYDDNYQIKEIDYPDTEIHYDHYKAIKESIEFAITNKSAIAEFNAVLQNEIESLDKLNEIFEYVKQQDCHSGHSEIDICIPFYYKTDGCYARAHKMKQIIENKFGYAIKKVFSYDSKTPRDDSSYTLAVKDGNKCIFWWYHVAALVKVRNNDELLEFVIDPSIDSERPLRLNEWISIQESNFCSPLARVGSTEERESFVYYPNGYRDDNYYKTNKILKKYK